MPEARRDREQAALAEERDFLLRSLEDLEAERRAGDIDETDYESLRASYVERTARTMRALDADSEGSIRRITPTSRGRRLRRFLGRRRTRRTLMVLCGCCFAVALVLVALSVAGVRLPGESATGSVNIPGNQSISQQLAAASILGAEGQLTEAISLYSAVLSHEPHNAEALANRGWLERLGGIAASSKETVRTGDGDLAEAVRVAPGYAPARALDGIARLDDDHDVAGATTEFNAFLADHPSASVEQNFGPEIALAYLQAKARVPAPFTRYLGKAASTPSGAAGS